MTTKTQTTATLKGAALTPESEIPSRALKLCRRVMSALATGNGRITVEVIEAHDGSWLLFVDGGAREYLGK